MSERGRAVMIGGVFLLSRDPAALAQWYARHLGWELGYVPEDDTYYTELYYRFPDTPDTPDTPDERPHLVYAIMPGDPGTPGTGHIVNYRVDDLDAVLASLEEAGYEPPAVTIGPDANGEGKFSRLEDPEGHRIELWEHL
jgi:catechol 2,3-dioxygenase-like lactoylglutathione lyase family enzyme